MVWPVFVKLVAIAISKKLAAYLIARVCCKTVCFLRPGIAAVVGVELWLSPIVPKGDSPKPKSVGAATSDAKDHPEESRGLVPVAQPIVGATASFYQALGPRGSQRSVG